MEIILSEIEARVLGCLIEKELSTPDYYALSLNALVNACNQKNNREPVTAFDESSVEQALESLRAKHLVETTAAARVKKYGETLVAARNLLPGEAAVLGELLLRGPQTAGELKGRAERMHKFEGLEQTEEALQVLAEAGLAKKLERQPGRKEPRWAHLLSGEPGAAAEAPPAVVAPPAENERLAKLEVEFSSLKMEFERLQQMIEDIKNDLKAREGT